MSDIVLGTKCRNVSFSNSPKETYNFVENINK